MMPNPDAVPPTSDTPLPLSQSPEDADWEAEIAEMTEEQFYRYLEEGEGGLAFGGA
jgi:hypothetical protein